MQLESRAKASDAVAASVAIDNEVLVVMVVLDGDVVLGNSEEDDEPLKKSVVLDGRVANDAVVVDNVALE
eukprot:6243300-Pyramimonas_sp.AAC.1